MEEAYKKYLTNIGNHTVTKNDHELANSIEIREQDLNEFKDVTGGVNTIIAPTGSGKTVFLKHLLSVVHKDYDKIYLMSRTAELQPAYDFFPRESLIDDYDEELMIEIWNGQLKDKQEGRKLKNILVILDDIIASPSYKKSKMIEEMATSARHLNITVWILSQNFTSIKPGIRNNIRIMVSFWLENETERNHVIDTFLSTINRRIGNLLFKRITQTKHQAIIVSMYKVGEPTEEKVKRLTANPKVKLVMKSSKPERVRKPENHRVLVKPLKNEDTAQDLDTSRRIRTGKTKRISTNN